jgi:hypothetical protein
VRAPRAVVGCGKARRIFPPDAPTPPAARPARRLPRGATGRRVAKNLRRADLWPGHFMGSSLKPTYRASWMHVLLFALQPSQALRI